MEEELLQPYKAKAMCLVCCLGIALVCVRASSVPAGWDGIILTGSLGYIPYGVLYKPPPDILVSFSQEGSLVRCGWFFFFFLKLRTRSASRPSRILATTLLCCVCFHTEMNRRKERREKPSRLGLLLIEEGQCYNCYI